MGGTILNGAHGILKFREFKNMTNATLMAALNATTPDDRHRDHRPLTAGVYERRCRNTRHH